MIKQSIWLWQTFTDSYTQRPSNFNDFIGQDAIKQTLNTAIQSASINGHALWHILFCGQSWYWKTTLATILWATLQTTTHTVTWYALTKPSDLVSLLNTLKSSDILFIDEIHRLKPALQEVLYIAMEDNCIDMVMPDWHHVRLPIEPFTLIWATTKSESLSEPLKNRFVYTFHLLPYTLEEKKAIIHRYLTVNWLTYTDNTIIDLIAQHVSSTPREITTLIIQLRDYCIVHWDWDRTISHELRQWFFSGNNINEWWLQAIHVRYLSILETYWTHPVWLWTLAALLGMNEKAIEKDIEPLLFALGKIEKTPRWRKLL